MTWGAATRETTLVVLSVLVVALVLLAPAAASADPAAVAPNNSSDGDDLVDDTTNATEDGLDDTTNATEDGLDDTTNATGDGLDDTTNATGDGLDDTTNATGDGLNDTANATGEVADDAAGSTLGVRDGVETSGTLDLAGTVVDSTTAAVDATTPVVEATFESVVATTGSLSSTLAISMSTSTNGLLDASLFAGDSAGTEDDGSGDGGHGDDGPTSASGSDGGSDGVRAAVGTGAERMPGDEGGDAGGGGSGSDVGEMGDDGGGVVGVGDAPSPLDASRPTGLALATVLATAALGGASTAGANAFDPKTAARTLESASTVTREHLRRIPGVPVYRYSRYDDSDPLEHDGREAIYEVIDDSPGIHLSGVGDAADASLSTVRHHLRVLEHERLVETEKVDGRRRYYPVGTDDPALQAALQDSTRAALLRALDDEGAAPNGWLADALDRDPSTVTYHLQKLEDDDLVVRESDGRSVVNRLAPDVADALPSPPGDVVDQPMPVDD